MGRKPTNTRGEPAPAVGAGVDAALPGPSGEPIAIIGVGGFWPGAHTLEAYLERLDRQESLFTPIPENHFPDPAIKNRRGAFLADIAGFDFGLFNIPRREADYMDPRQRLLLMSVWQVLEDACYSPEELSGARVDVYVASEGAPYANNVAEAEVTAYSSTGVNSWAIPNRISHHFRFTGKSVFLDTACSGASVAVHEAMQSLRAGRAEYAVVGAANLLFGDAARQAYLGQESLGILENREACFPFQDSANGFLPAECVAAILLKPLSAALRDQDNIHAVLLGSGVNHVGGHGSLAAPSAAAQAEAIFNAYLDAGVHPGTVTYLEAHAASSTYADSQEIEGFKAADRKLQEHYAWEDVPPCKISTGKPNVGHANSASGLLSLVRVLHAFKTGKRQGIWGFQGCAATIDLTGARFHLSNADEEWTQLVDGNGTSLPRRAAINSFGAGGTNAFVILEEHRPSCQETPARLTSEAERGAHFLALSARTEGQLVEYAARVARFLEREPAIAPAQLEHLFAYGRKALPKRVVLRFEALMDLRPKLAKYVEAAGAKGYYLKGGEEEGVAAFFSKHPKLADYVESLGETADKSLLFELWAKGVERPLAAFLGRASFRKRSLPTYPFERPICWIAERPRQASASSDASGEVTTVACSSLSSRGYLLEQHVVRGRKVLPGVAYLELVTEELRGNVRAPVGEVGVRLSNVLWLQPFIADHGEQNLQIQLSRGGGGGNGEKAFQFEVFSGVQEDASKRFVHASGEGFVGVYSEAPALEAAELEAAQASGYIGRAQCYAAFRSLGFEHGLAYQCLERLHVVADEAGRTRVFARLRLPDLLRGTIDEYVLHPCLMDAATQAALGLFLDISETSGRVGGELSIEATRLRPYLPLAVDEVTVFRRCPQSLWVRLAYAPAAQGSASLVKLDIDVFDDDAAPCVSMRGFAIRRLGADWNPGDDLLSDQRRDGRLASEIQTPNLPTPDLVGIEEDLEGVVVAYLVEAFSSILQLPRQQLRVDAHFEQLGLTSLTILELTKQLEKLFGKLSKTLLFEHHSFSELADYLIEHHEDVLPRILSEREPRPLSSSSSASLVGEDLSGPVMEDPRGETPRPAPSAALGSVQEEPSPIAIVGMSGKFPQADDLEQFWENLARGRDCITEVPPERWDWRRYYTSDRRTPGAHYSKWGGFISDVDKFDPLFFHISPKEAELLDPQERLFLEHAWMALEDAGYTRKSLDSRAGAGGSLGRQVGVYAGVMYNEYQLLGAEQSLMGTPIGFASSAASVANRVSYVFDLHGPSLTVDTMCSSSLTALNLACQDLGAMRVGMALAGGVNTIIHPNKYFMLSAGQFISSQGRCESFGQGADGYIPGEGVGVIVLKRLADAERDGDHIYAVIKSVSVNHGGMTSGYTVPNPNAQRSLVEDVLRKAAVDPRTLSYVEAHGTGTKLGDPIEVAALTRAFGRAASPGHCWLGSVKSNIGHCESAAGVAGLIKVILQLRHGKIAPSLHSGKLNPDIAFERTPFVVNQTLRDWERPVIDGVTYPRIAGISSFGAGGSNANVVVEEYLDDDVSYTTDREPDEPVAVVLSARNETALKAYAAKLVDFIDKRRREGTTDASGGRLLRRLAYTLQVGREQMAQRLGVVARSLDELTQALNAYRDASGAEPTAEALYHGNVRRDMDALAAELAGEDPSEVAKHCFVVRDLTRLLSLWVKGLDVDWTSLYRGACPKRISLPTYPFARDRYWFHVDPLPGEANSLSLVRPSAADLDLAAAEASRDQQIAAPAALLATEWTAKPIAHGARQPRLRNRHVLVLDAAERERAWDKLQAGATFELVKFDAQSCEGPSGRSFTNCATALFQALRRVLRTLPSRDVLFQVLVPTDTADIHYTALSALVLSAAHERKGVVAQLVAMDLDAPTDQIAARLQEDAARPEDATVAYHGNVRYVRTATAIPAQPSRTQSPWREGGTYLICGGVGRLGRTFAREIAEQTNRCTLVLTGRSPPNERSAAILEELRARGADAVYYSADLCNERAVRALVRLIDRENGSLTAVVQSAGGLNVRDIVEKSEAEFAGLLAPRVAGVLNLDKATAALDLDFFVLFSCLSGVLGGAGRSDLATGAAFMDAFAVHRNAEVRAGRRKGRTLSIDWPTSLKPGVSGAEPFDARAGLLQAFYASMACGADQVLVAGDDELSAAILSVLGSAGAADGVDAAPVSGLERRAGLAAIG